MQIELSRETFRRLVKLYLVGLPLYFSTALYEGLNPRWSQFDGRFDRISHEQFGYAFDPEPVVIIVFVALLVMIIASAFGLLRFAPWARTIFLGAFVVGWPLSWWLGGPAQWSSNAADFVGSLLTMLDGAILLLAYARGYGSEWFADRPLA